jgi:SAM-dependent methyltransferase
MQDGVCVCSGSLVRAGFSKHFDKMECRSCGSSHFVTARSLTDPAPTFKYDESNDKYAEESYLRGRELRWAHTQILRADWAGRKVLEIGCFNGFFLSELAGLGADVYGFDLNPKALSVGRTLFGLAGRLDTSLDRLAENGPFDDVVCIDVLEHMEAPAEFLGVVRGMLSPNGRIFVAGPTVERRFHDKSDFPPHHKWWFSRRGLRAMLEKGGFEVTDTKIQRDGALLIRNFVGRGISGFGRREFFGEVAVSAPSLESGLAKGLYRFVAILLRLLFTGLRFSYCSTVLIARKVN